MNLLAELRQRFSVALESLEPGTGELGDMVLPSKDAKHGDYQANCAMPLGKRLKQPPREIAQQLVDRLDLRDLCEAPEIAGPGFINLRVKDDWLTSQLQATLSDVSQVGLTPVDEPQTYVLDYSSPNVAKPMHVGHIRSTVIGAALYRVLKQLGHRVISDNHIGDWGTQFGMIIYGYKHFVDEAALAKAMVPRAEPAVQAGQPTGRLPRHAPEKDPCRRAADTRSGRSARRDARRHRAGTRQRAQKGREKVAAGRGAVGRPSQNARRATQDGRPGR